MKNIKIGDKVKCLIDFNKWLQSGDIYTVLRKEELEPKVKKAIKLLEERGYKVEK